MALKLADAFVLLGANRDGLKKDLAEGKRDTDTWARAVSVAAGNLLGNVIQAGAQMAARAVVGLGREIMDMVTEAAEVEGVRNTFVKLAESVGGDAVKALNDLRAATRGMVSDADLMSAGNKFLAMGLAENTDQAAELAEVATQLGMAMGEDATASMENFALMLANQSIPRLDSFGISSATVRARIEELTASEEGMTRETAFMQAVMEQARVTMAKVGEQGNTAAAGMARIKSTLANLKLAAGEALSPILDLVVGIASNLVEGWGGKFLDWLAFIKPAVEDFAAAFKLLIDGDVDGFLGKLSDALIALGVPEETVTKVIDSIKTMFSAFEDLKAGNYEEFIGKMKAALVELGVPIEVVDGLEKAFRWLLQAVADVSDFWENTFKPLAIELWNNVLKPALEGLWQLITDLKPVFIALGAAVLLYFIAPMLLAALPVLALGAALIALGLIWREHGDQVKVIVGQIGVIVSHVFTMIIEWVRAAIEAIVSIEGPFGDMLRSILGDGQQTLSVLDGVIERMRAANQERAEALLTQPAPAGGGFDAAAAWAGIQELFGGNQDNSQNMSVYGVNIFNPGDSGAALQELWEMGQ